MLSNSFDSILNTNVVAAVETKRRYLHFLHVGLKVFIAVVALSVGAPRALDAQSLIQPPTKIEIHKIEAKVRMPRGAFSIRKYVRYYYAVEESGGRRIKGMYVEKSYLTAKAIPEEGFVVVSGESEIPAPYDAGCSVVFVAYDLRDASRVSTYCSAELLL
jgi:hypothetical protein